MPSQTVRRDFMRSQSSWDEGERLEVGGPGFVMELERGRNWCGVRFELGNTKGPAPRPTPLRSGGQERELLHGIRVTAGGELDADWIAGLLVAAQLLGL